MTLKRLLKHLTIGKWHVQRALDRAARDTLANIVRAAEHGSSAQIRVVIEPSLTLGQLLRKQSARERAIDVFAHERVWDTSFNNGVLLYVLLAERDAEIIADRGLNGKVSDAEWADICGSLEREVPIVGFVTALSQAIERIGGLLRREFPCDTSVDELKNEVRIG